MKAKFQLIWKMQFGFGAALAVLLVVGVVSYRSLLASAESERWVQHTHDVLEHLESLLSAMENIDTGDRGFALSGEETLLRPSGASKSLVNKEQKTLRALTTDNPSQQRRLDTVAGLAEQTIQLGDALVRLRRTGSAERAAEAIRKGQSEEVLDRFRAVIRDMKDEEHRLLLQRDAESERNSRQNKAVVLLGSTLGILIAVGAGWTVRHDLAARELAEEKYRGLLEAAPDAMLVVNQGGKIVLLNVQAERQFGYHRNELVGQQVKNIIPEGFAERLIADALRSSAEALAQQIGTGIELAGRRKDGSEFPIEIMLSPLESAGGILVTAAIRNITTRKKAEAHLLQKVEELKRSNEELEQFANIASHDLQEPLRMVASYTQLLSTRYKGKLDSDADDFIAFAVGGANRMQRLIQDLLAYSRVGTKGKDLLDTSSEEALQVALANLRGAIEESGALVTHDPLPAVLADETQLVQLFQNLVGNGIKYQNPGVPQVHISATKNGGEKWIFSVQDNGLGIDSQYFEKIFGMFQRLHKREEFAGTGIGLAICKKIVERHGGSISVESQPGQGSIFRFGLTKSRGIMKGSGG